MIHVYMRGRLGNQLFQYAFVRILQINNPSQKVVWHWNEVECQGLPENGWCNSLVYFNTVDTSSGNEEFKPSFFQKIILKLYWWRYPHNKSIDVKNKYQKRWIKIVELAGLYYLDLGYYPFKTKIRGDILVSGNFESPRYFDAISDTIMKEITPKNDALPANRELYEIIKNNNSVCVSIRRGDYVSNIGFSKLFSVCNEQYYSKAINYIKDKVDNPVFVFFSDDIDWVRENLKCDMPCYYESGTDPIWEKLRLMYSCKHFIISNSTFSWWAQYLGRSIDKIVVAPSRWYNNSFVPDLINKNWIKI